MRIGSSLQCGQAYIVFATYLQIRITLQTNMFIASDERILCWGQTLVVLETNAFELEMN